MTTTTTTIVKNTTNEENNRCNQQITTASQTKNTTHIQSNDYGNAEIVINSEYITPHIAQDKKSLNQLMLEALNILYRSSKQMFKF